jgi:poly-gamma-glutamate synthesis protein (capsule biosynthesis protein)
MPESEFNSLQQTGEALDQFIDMDGEPRGTDEEKPGEMEIFRRNFAIGDEHVIRMEANENDVEEITAVVNNASRVADFTIVTIHAHQYAGRRELSPEFLHVFARAMIEAGDPLQPGQFHLPERNPAAPSI